MILEAAGVHDVLAKSLGSSNAINVAGDDRRPALRLMRPDEIARRRGQVGRRGHAPRPAARTARPRRPSTSRWRCAEVRAKRVLQAEGASASEPVGDGGAQPRGRH